MERQLHKNENKTNVKRKQTNHTNANESAAMSSASQRQPPRAFSLFFESRKRSNSCLPHFRTENRGPLFLEML